MELCTLQAISKLHTHNLHSLNPNTSFTTNLHCSSKPSLLSLTYRPSLTALRLHSRSTYFLSFVLKATSSEETSSTGAGYGSNERDGVATIEDAAPAEKEINEEEAPSPPPPVYEETKQPEVITEEEPPSPPPPVYEETKQLEVINEKEPPSPSPPVYEENKQPEVITEEEPLPPVYVETKESEVITKEESPFYGKSADAGEAESSSDEQFSVSEILDKLNIDTSNPYSLVLYGSSTLFVLWLSSAVVGAIDAIPLFPKLMELVGLGYTAWFTYRYLIFKSQREELFAKLEELKEEVFGSIDD